MDDKWQACIADSVYVEINVDSMYIQSVLIQFCPNIVCSVLGSINRGNYNFSWSTSV